MTRLRGHDAIRYAATHGRTLSKYTSPTSEARDGLTVAEAREIARVDPSLIYLEVSRRRIEWLPRYRFYAPGLPGLLPALDGTVLTVRAYRGALWLGSMVDMGDAGPPALRSDDDTEAMAARFRVLFAQWRETDEARRMGESPLRSHETGDDDDTDGGSR